MLYDIHKLWTLAFEEGIDVDWSQINIIKNAFTLDWYLSKVYFLKDDLLRALMNAKEINESLVIDVDNKIETSLVITT